MKVNSTEKNLKFEKLPQFVYVSATFLLLCKILDRQSDLINRIRRLELQRGLPPDSAAADIPLPLYETGDDLKEIHPNLVRIVCVYFKLYEH
jgi:hypothetical protein